MGNKMKRLICALLTSAMLVSSVGIAAFAANEDTAAETTTVEASDSSTADQTDEEKEAEDAAAADTETTAEATEAPAAEATEAPAEAEATEAPAAEATEAPVTTTTTAASSSYDKDNYYQKALALCSSLGIISGYEDGSVRPESNVTRAEMASIVLRMLATSSNSTYQNVFTDVASTHWAADQIQTAYDGGIISGMGDGTFQPDSQVTYAQVIVMLVNAMNYTDDAMYYGGYPDGYIKAAGMSGLNLVKNAPGVSDVASDRGTVIKMVYNALLGDYKEIKSYVDGSPKYESTETLAEAKFDVIEKKGMLIGTAKTTIGTADLQDGQVEILANDEDDTVVYDTVLTGLEDYLAQKVTFYYRENSGRTAEVLAVSADSSKSETVVIDDPDDIETIEGFEDKQGVIKISGVSKKKDCKDAVIVYNGKVLTDAQLAEIGEDINDMLVPEVGTVKLVNSDKSTDVYDVIFVDSYETVVVSSVSTDRLTGKVSAGTADDIGATKAYTLNLDDSEDRTVSVNRAGTEVKLRNLKKNDVASVKASYDNTVVDIVVTGESITGTPSGITKKLDESHANINGDRYEVANVAVGDLKTGSQCVFYLDMFGRIGYIEGSTSGRLDSGQKYGWLMNAYTSENGRDYIVQIMTQDGKAEEYNLSNKINYWEPNQTDIGTTQRSDEYVYENLVSRMADDDFPHMWVSERNTRTTTPDGGRPLMWKQSHSIRLVKYKANSSGNISELYGAVNVVNQDEKYYTESKYTEVDRNTYGAKYNNASYAPITDPYIDSATVQALKDSDALIFDMTNLSGKTLVGGLVGGYVITDGIAEFDVSKDATSNPSKYKDADAYVVKTVTASAYNLRENGVSDDFIMADQDGTAPGVLIRFISDATEPVNPFDLDNVASTPSMVVDSIDTSVNDDDDTIYVINGYLGGSEVSVTTNTTSALGLLTAYDDKKYSGTKLWDADSDKALTDFLKEGDIIITNGTHILLYASAEDIYTNLRKGKDVGKYVSGSETRNYFWFDRVTDSDISDVSWMSIGSNVLSADPSMPMDVVEIDLAATSPSRAVSIVDDVDTIADTMVYSADSNEYDYAYARFASKGSLQEVILYRIKNADLIGIDPDTEEE